MNKSSTAYLVERWELPKKEVCYQGLTQADIVRWINFQKSTLQMVGDSSLPNDRMEWWKYTSPRMLFGILEKDLEYDSKEAKLGEVEVAVTGPQVSVADSTGQNVKTFDSIKSYKEDPFGLLHEMAPIDLGARSIFFLQQLFSSVVTLIRIPSGATFKEPFLIKAKARNAVGSYLTIILVESGASVEFVEEAESYAGSSLLMGRTEILVDAQGACSYTLSGSTKGEHSLFHRIRGHIGREASLDITSAIFGAKAARIEVDCLMKKDGGQAKIRSLAIGGGRSHFDLHTNQIHLAPNCRSELAANAVMSDRARSVYYGLIEVAENAHGTDAYQSSKNLLLSDEARADSVPNLRILANEVKCSHGATVAQLSDDELFYLQARGISRLKAESLLVSGFIGRTIAEIPGKAGREKVESTLSITGMSLEV